MSTNRISAKKGTRNDASIKHQSVNVSRANESHFQPCERMTLIPANELVTLLIRPRKKHWGLYIQSNQTGMIYGERGGGKTWLAMGLAISISTRKDFLGNKPGKARRVNYLDGEMDLVTFQKRMRQICESLGVEPPADLKVFTPESFTDLLPSINTSEGQKLIDMMLGTDWDVLIVDNYSAWSSDGRETAEAWAPYMRWMLGHKRAGRTVIVIHHSGKAGKQRGSSKHEDALDWSINLLPDKQGLKDGALRFSLVWEKARHLASDQIAPIAVTMRHGEDGVLTWEHQQGTHKDPKIAKAIKLHQQGKTNIEIAAELDVDRTTVGRWLKAA
jgi:RecA-family ATPase